MGEFYINKYNEYLVEKYTEDKRKSVLIDFQPNSNTLMITFSSLHRGFWDSRRLNYSV